MSDSDSDYEEKSDIESDDDLEIDLEDDELIEPEPEDLDIDLEDASESVRNKPIVLSSSQVTLDDDKDDNVNYFQKFELDITPNYVSEFHPECLNHNYDEIAKLSMVVRDVHNVIIDDLHKTIPLLTKYEKAKVLGQRAKQIENGATPFVKVPANVIDGYTIAELELKQKRIPFIIRRPIPSGATEYWNLKDLENLSF
jgi:DNA-directed RNA polymerase subunit K/omega